MNCYTIILMNTGSWRVHKAGCKDIQKDVRQSNGEPWTAVYESVDALIKAEVKSLDESFGEPSGYGPEHFEILPCARRTA